VTEAIFTTLVTKHVGHVLKESINQRGEWTPHVKNVGPGTKLLEHLA